MSIRTLSLGIAGFGALLFVLAVIIWTSNRTDFHARAASTCGMFGSPGGAQYQQCWAHAKVTADEASAGYTACLFNASGGYCREVGAVPYFSVGGLLILVIGSGLFLMSGKRRAE